MFDFGIGHMFAVQADGTSIEFGTLQDASIDFSFDKKELYGRKSFPVHVARGKGKLDGKANYADIKAANLNLVLNGTVSTGSTIVSEPINTTIPATTPYTITITPPNSGTMGAVRAVYDVSGDTKSPMKLVTGTPTTGEYSYATGTLTFAAADEGKKVQYQYDYTTTTGKTITLTNSMMGTAPTFELELYSVLDGKQICLVLNKCTTTKLGLSFKNEDYSIPALEFSAFADASDTVGMIYLVE